MFDEKQFREGGRLLPLHGRTVAVTRARTQSAEMTTDLEALGATVIHCPMIEIAPPDSWAPLDTAISRLADYDWLVFTSANGVEFFFQRLRDTVSEAPSTLKKLSFGAIGPTTAGALENEAIAPNVVAAESRAEGALAAIIDYLGGKERVRGLSFLIPRAAVAREVLPEGLRALGARVDAVEAYQTIRPQIDSASLVRLFTETRIDAITFTSSSTVSNFAALIGVEDLSSLLANTIAFCIGPVTAHTAERYRIPNIVHPQRYNSRALVDAIVKSLGSR